MDGRIQDPRVTVETVDISSLTVPRSFCFNAAQMSGFNSNILAIVAFTHINCPEDLVLTQSDHG